MYAPRPLIAAEELLVGRGEEHDPHQPGRGRADGINGADEILRFREDGRAIHVAHVERHDDAALDSWGLVRQKVKELGKELGREPIHSDEAKVLKDLQRHRLARAAHPRHDDELPDPLLQSRI